METADASLPPLRLAPPAVSRAASRSQVAYAPRHISTPIVPLKPVASAPQRTLVTASYGQYPSAWTPSVPSNHWMWIVVHHSDSAYGSAAIIDKWHRDRGFDELGYHFVIGNGTNSGDGQVEVGPRWIKQKWGAHDNALDNRYNTNGIGICLVGNFENNRPTAQQIKSLDRLVVFLMKKYNVPVDHVLGHGETKDTQCPGRFLHVATIRAQVQKMIAMGETLATDEYADRR
jgi:hypothetical protein